MNLTEKSRHITEFAMSYGLVVCMDRTDRTMHQASTTRQGSWMEIDLFKKMNTFNQRVLSRNWRDRW